MDKHPPQHPLLKILPGADNIGARLALLVFGCAILAGVLWLLSLMEITSLSPVDMEGKTFFWVVWAIAIAVIVLTTLMWFVIDQEVLKPLNQIHEIAHAEDDKGLIKVAATMREMRDSIEKTQAALDESHETLRQVEKLAMVGKLAAGVAHSVRNPLTSVNLRLFSLSRGLKLNARQEEDFKVIADAVRHIDSVLSNFLEFSRRPHLNRKHISPRFVVDSCLKLLDNRLSTFPVQVKKKYMDSVPDIFADPDQLQEALLNILLNACESIDYNGTIEVSESIHRLDDEDFIFISIKDSGPGIDHDIESLFVPFYSTKEQGTGLGLPIAKGILEEHGGDIYVYSSPGQGTKMSLAIPLTHDLF